MGKRDPYRITHCTDEGAEGYIGGGNEVRHCVLRSSLDRGYMCTDYA